MRLLHASFITIDLLVFDFVFPPPFDYALIVIINFGIPTCPSAGTVNLMIIAFAPKLCCNAPWYYLLSNHLLAVEMHVLLGERT
jgi:hypothetical protein